MATIKVQNIPPYINEDEFKRLFSQLEGCGTCNLVAMPNQDSVGYAQFATQQSAASARSMYSNWQGWGVKGLFIEAVPVTRAPQVAIKREREEPEADTDAGAAYKQTRALADANSVPSYSPTNPGAGMPAGPFTTQTSIPHGSQAQQRPSELSYNVIQQALQQQQGFSAPTSQPSGAYASSQPFPASQAQGSFAPSQQFTSTQAPQGFNQQFQTSQAQATDFAQNQASSISGQRQAGYRGGTLPNQLSGDPSSQQLDPRAAQALGQRQPGYQAAGGPPTHLSGNIPIQQAATPPAGGPPAVQQAYGGPAYGQPPAQQQPQLAQQHSGQQYNPQGQAPQPSLQAPPYQAPQYGQMNQFPPQGQAVQGGAPGIINQPANAGYAPQPYISPHQQHPQQLLDQLASGPLANLIAPNLGVNLGALGSLGVNSGQGLSRDAITQLLQLGGLDPNALQQQQHNAAMPPPRPAAPEALPLPADAMQTLYIDGMPLDVTKREMCHIFRPFEGFKEVRLVNKTDKTGQPMMLCFAEFEAVHLAAAALNTLQGYSFDMSAPEEHRLRISFAKPTKPSDPRSRMGNGSRHSAYNPVDLPPARDSKPSGRWDNAAGGTRSDWRGGERRTRDRDTERSDRRSGNAGQDRRGDEKRRRY